MQILLALCLLAQAKAGDKMSVSVDSEMDLEIEVRDGIGESRRVLNAIRKEKFAQQVLEVSEGRPRSVRIQCLSSTLQKSGTDAPIAAAVPTPLSGGTFTAQRGASGWSVLDQEGNVPPPVGQGLGAWNDAARLLPKGEARQGSTWDVAAADVMALFSPGAIQDAQGTISCKCEAVDANRIAVSFTGGLNGMRGEESVLKLEVKIASGELVYDLSKGRPVSLKVTGSVQSVQDMIDVFRRPNEEQEERRKVGEIVVKSRKMEVAFAFSD